MTRIAYFADVTTNNNQLEYLSEDKLIRKGLVFYAGDHTDSKQRHHNFPEERVIEIVDNTNKLINQGTSIPILKDHSKTVDASVGHIEAPLEVRRIQKDDLPHPRMTKLLGKLGVFCDGLVLKGADIVSKFKSGAIRTVSPGIDVVTNTLRELSITPTPAIDGLVMYNANFALTFDELENESGELEAIEEEFNQLSNNFWSIIKNINKASEEDLTQLQMDSNSLMNQALEDYLIRLQNLLGLNNSEEQYDLQQTPQSQQNQQNQQNIQPPLNRGRGQFNAPLAAYSMSEMQSLAEFGYRQAITGAIRSLQNRKSTGRTLGQIGTTFKTKIGNATRGKVHSISRGVRRIGSNIRNTFSGNTPKPITKLSDKQVGIAKAAKTKYGVQGLRKNPVTSPVNTQPLDKYQQALKGR